MWLADQWKDYEVIDCSCGEKLERWGDYILVRPDPQVIWDTPRNAGNTRTDIITAVKKVVGNGNFLTCRNNGVSITGI